MSQNLRARVTSQGSMRGLGHSKQHVPLGRKNVCFAEQFRSQRLLNVTTTAVYGKTTWDLDSVLGGMATVS